MTVVFLDPVGTLGGAERSMLDLAASLRTVKPDLQLALITGADGPLVSAASAIGMKVRVLPLPARAAATGDSSIDGHLALLTRAPALLRAGTQMIRYGARLRREIARLQPSLVHSNGMKMHVLAAAFRLPDVPVIWHLRDFVGQRVLMAPALRALASRVDGVIAISESVRDDATRALRRTDVAVIYNAIDVDVFTPQGERLELGADEDSHILRVGLVATYARWKGHEVFLDAAAQLHASHPHLRFYIVGGRTYATEGSEYSDVELRALIASRGIGSVTALVPFQTRPELAYRTLDIVVHASTRPEPFGRTIAEAMACGRPVIATMDGGATELIEDGVDSLGVPPRDACALARAIASLAEDRDLRTRLGHAARATASRRFSRTRLAPEVLRVYSRLR